jgi:hypothetical protein
MAPQKRIRDTDISELDFVEDRDTDVGLSLIDEDEIEPEEDEEWGLIPELDRLG